MPKETTSLARSVAEAHKDEWVRIESSTWVIHTFGEEFVLSLSQNKNGSYLIVGRGAVVKCMLRGLSSNYLGPFRERKRYTPFLGAFAGCPII